MLALVLCLITCATTTQTYPFIITQLIVPEFVPTGQQQVDIECRYNANFTMLNWYKGSYEFFRYKPSGVPSTRTFPINGVGTIELLACGPAVCRLRLGSLSEEATGFYRCDIEREIPPYKFETRSTHMRVHGHDSEPLLEGMAEEYGEDDTIKAYCRRAPGSVLRWYINQQEIEELRGFVEMERKSYRNIFLGFPPTLTVQCAAFRYGKMYVSNTVVAKWNGTYNNIDDIEIYNKKPANSGSPDNVGYICLLSLGLYLFF